MIDQTASLRGSAIRVTLLVALSFWGLMGCASDDGLSGKYKAVGVDGEGAELTIAMPGKYQLCIDGTCSDGTLQVVWDRKVEGRIRFDGDAMEALVRRISQTDRLGLPQYISQYRGHVELNYWLNPAPTIIAIDMGSNAMFVRR